MKLLSCAASLLAFAGAMEVSGEDRILVGGSTRTALRSSLSPEVLKRFEEQGLLEQPLPRYEHRVEDCSFDGDVTCPYIDTVEELLSWTPADAKQPVAEPYTPKVKAGTKIVHVHDMMNGYGRDPDYYYRKGFGGWDFIDSFVYFSHRRVAVPPVSWINECHARDIPVLGTLITEDANSVRKVIDNAPAVADKLAEIADYYGFDGWLINIEYSWSPISSFVPFLESLRDQMHDLRGPGTEVQYYDSMNSQGRISYQNALNSENKAYFDASDTILTNYWIDSRGVSLQTSADTAGDRNADVLIGVDCWARGTYYSPGKDLARPIKDISSYNLTAGLFAPGWTYENGIRTPDNATWIAADKEYWLDIAAAFGRL